ncbi:MAG: type IV toxin-antitoxin system AbiEi family antitoxin domain-containing protein [Candidatus Cloacimonetes bacterium]|nr:type IV toxin-antitoxin system AbiEi family antitoxin domain-containing protein [Candidatus Cloacimonadota bacterium]
MKQLELPNEVKIFSIDDLKKLGLSHHKIHRLVEEGTIKKLNRKFYENLRYVGDESDLFYVYAYVPKGIVCLMSAARIYNLTTFQPEGVDVAIERKMKIATLPEWPQIHLHYFNQLRFETGISRYFDAVHEIPIYNAEKTVVDIISFRNKIGIEETKEVLTNYLKRTDRNINQLYRYAELLQCRSTLDTYLQVLL